jgi:hypothetical protein
MPVSRLATAAAPQEEKVICLFKKSCWQLTTTCPHKANPMNSWRHCSSYQRDYEKAVISLANPGM